MSLSHFAFALSTLLCALSGVAFPVSQSVFFGGLLCNATDPFLRNVLTVSKVALATFIFTLLARHLLLT